MAETWLNVGVNIVTFTVIVSVQPKLFLYVIKDFPKALAFTNPVPEIVATEVLLEIHGLEVAAVPDPVS